MKKRSIFLPVLVFGFYACQREKPLIPVVVNLYYKKAESFSERRNDSAFCYFNKAAGSSKDSLQVARAYNRMAAIQSDAGDYFGCQESLLMSLKYLREGDDKDRKCLSSDYNELGMASFNLKNYDAAISFYQLAMKFLDNNKFKAVLINNEANAYQKKGGYDRALRLYHVAMGRAGADQATYARILTNLAITKWLQQPGYNAAPELMKALRLRQKENDLWGENSSYVHLAEYYAHSHPDSALIYAGKMYAVATRINSPDDRLDALQKLAALGPAGTTKRYFFLYQRLDDSLQTARNAAKNQFALIRYDAEKNKADNLKLQKDNSDKRYEIARQRLWLGISLFVFIAGSIIAVRWYRKRKHRLEREAQESIRENEFKTYKKVHDVVVNGLHRVMSEVENQDGVDKELLLGKLDRLYERSRQITYETAPPEDLNFHERIAGLILSFSTPNRKIALVGNDKTLWARVTPQVKYELEPILQELLVNMKKHSQARHVAVRFAQQGNWINLYYADDGVGLPADFRYGNGLKNTGTRIEDIGGTISFEPIAVKGLKILIAFPINNDDDV